MLAFRWLKKGTENCRWNGTYSYKNNKIRYIKNTDDACTFHSHLSLLYFCQIKNFLIFYHVKNLKLFFIRYLKSCSCSKLSSCVKFCLVINSSWLIKTSWRINVNACRQYRQYLNNQSFNSQPVFWAAYSEQDDSAWCLEEPRTAGKWRYDLSLNKEVMRSR